MTTDPKPAIGEDGEALQSASPEPSRGSAGLRLPEADGASRPQAGHAPSAAFRCVVSWRGYNALMRRQYATLSEMLGI